MIRALNVSNERFLSHLSQIQKRLEAAQRQISSGRKLSTPSDDPDHVSAVLQARADLEQVRQIQKDLSRVKAEVDTAEQALQQTALLLDRVQTLGAQGINGTQTAATRGMIAVELEVIFGQLVNIARSSVDGRYIFSGDSDQVPPYTVDLTQPNGVSAYAGSAATRQTRHPSGTTFSIARTAQDIFDSGNPGSSIFAAVNSLRAALQNNDEASMAAAIGNVNGAANHLNQVLASYGSGQNQVQEALNVSSNLEVTLQSELSVIQDADLAAAILELQQGQTAQEAALTSRAQLPRGSLFDYL
jgi:flagellar hook-associated protein 3 FlgL